MRKIIFILVLLISFTIGEAMAADFQARVSRTEVPYGEALLLLLEYDGTDNNLRPDLSELNKDFSIFSTSQSFSTQIINGQKSSKHQWQVSLMPKHSGSITIPAISLGTMKSQPIPLNVFEGNINGQDGTPLYTRFSLSAETDKKEVFVQQQINYTLTLLDAGGLQSDAPEFLGNENNEWIIKQLQKPTVEYKNIDGVNTREIKFYYALFPQKSGKLTTPVAQLNGFHIAPSQKRNNFNNIFSDPFFDAGIEIFDMVSARSPISLSVKPIEIDIKPIPAIFADKWWLPAKNVSVSAEWEDSDPQFMVGQAVSRNITIEATGVLDTQIPDINPINTPALKQYPEKPQLFSFIENNGDIVAVKEFANVYIPQKAGKITLPQIVIYWWNTDKNSLETAIIPEEDIVVSPNPELSHDDTKTSEAINNKIVAETLAETQRNGENITESKFNILSISALIIVAFLMGILSTYLLMKKKTASNPKSDKVFSVKMLEEYAKKEDFKNLREELLLWGISYFDNDNLADLTLLGEMVKDKNFSEQLSVINKNIYGTTKTNWNAEGFIKCFNSINKKKKRKQKDEQPLPKLYKD